MLPWWDNNLEKPCINKTKASNPYFYLITAIMNILLLRNFKFYDRETPVVYEISFEVILNSDLNFNPGDEFTSHLAKKKFDHIIWLLELYVDTEIYSLNNIEMELMTYF